MSFLKAVNPNSKSGRERQLAAHLHDIVLQTLLADTDRAMELQTDAPTGRFIARPTPGGSMRRRGCCERTHDDRGSTANWSMLR